MVLRHTLVLVVLVVLVAVAACSAGASAPSPQASAGASAAASASAPSATDDSVDSPEEAARRIAAINPPLAGVKEKDPDAIGQAHWWEATKTNGAWRLEFHVGWGDCIAGCIDEHVWVYEVERDGGVELRREDGEPVPKEVLADLAGQGGIVGTGIGGFVTAGPMCPVVTPSNPKCDDRPVQGVVIIVRGSDGVEVARAQSDPAGRYALELPPGDYVVEPQAVDGLMGTPEPQKVAVAKGETTVDFVYDTGIR